ncbi:hypothetical protein MUK42_16303 [Musa troglodytarum]|uniref:Uncharacterized protein n=1 Tax=Musa troglodytarum TaxID=320322 RepID=A0A9E7KY74_9LILI|nr:hypothetical protein MUK42_16303 [Musa troglodytarum]
MEGETKRTELESLIEAIKGSDVRGGIRLQLRVGGRMNLDGWQIEVSINSRQMGLECNCYI